MAVAAKRGIRYHPQGAACRGEAPPRPYFLVVYPHVIDGLGRAEAPARTRRLPTHAVTARSQALWKSFRNHPGQGSHRCKKLTGLKPESRPPCPGIRTESRKQKAEGRRRTLCLLQFLLQRGFMLPALCSFAAMDR